MDCTSRANVRDPRQLRITMRPDLIITLRDFHEGPCYVVEDPISTRFFRVGIQEGRFLGLLTGRQTLDEALQRSAQLGQHSITQQEAIAIVRWLVDNRLAEVSDSQAEGLGLQVDHSSTASDCFDPLAIRLPLLRPERFIERLVPWCQWLLSPAMPWLGGGLVLFAIWRVALNWNRFSTALFDITVPHSAPALAAVWLLLKILHELAHMLVCAKYGGRVNEAGVMLLWGLPVPYVDVTSSWSFRSRAARIHTAAAGMMIELVLAAVAALAWERLPVGVLSQICLHVVLVATVASLLFNANPLMRFDGYYILMDLLDIPNLATRGARFWRSWVGRILGSSTSAAPPERGWQGQVIAWYGALALLWRCIVYATLSLIIVASLPVSEGHALLALLLLIALIVVVQQSARWRYRTKDHTGFELRSAAVGAVLLAIAGLTLCCVSWPGRLTAPGVVQYAPLHMLRATSPSLVQQLHVASGQQVKQGQTLVHLHSPELLVELADLELAIDQSELSLRSLQYHREFAAHTAELQKLRDLRRQHAEKLQQIAKLTVRAPGDGKVISRGIEVLQHSYVWPGNQLVATGDEAQKELEISIGQEDVQHFSAALGQDVLVRVGGKRCVGRLARLAPQASLLLPASSLAASEGGPLPVRHPEGGTNTEVELLAPRFTGYVQLEPADALTLGAGQRGQVSLAAPRRSIGSHLIQLVRQWCRDRVRSLRG